MTGSALSLAALRKLTPVQAAARLIAMEDTDPSIFAQWLADSDDNRQAWSKAQIVWGIFDDAAEDAMIAAMTRAARQAGSNQLPDGISEPANDRTWRVQLAAAAAVLIIATSIVFGIQSYGLSGTPSTVLASADRGNPLSRFGKPDYMTGNGQTSMINLPDGTRVTLAPDSLLDLAYDNGHRNLRLIQGRAYFDVAHDTARPFTVEAYGRMVTAFGTRFDVYMMPGIVRVVLAQGSVSISRAPGGKMEQSPVRLRPGQAYLAIGNKPGIVSVTNVDKDMVWRESFLSFDNRPLPEVIDKLNRSTRAQIFIRDPSVASMRVTAQFKTGNVERFGRALALALPVRLVARGVDRYEIVRRH
jgi:transmembrane sensor